ncbi:hypothetical protein ACFWBI_05275 [Streptomyces sp. NPDC059982]
MPPPAGAPCAVAPGDVLDAAARLVDRSLVAVAYGDRADRRTA